jgi:predicted dehydrogenase
MAKRATRSKKIRLGVVRADTHAYYYGVMLGKPDPIKLQQNDYVIHHYASDIYNPKRLINPRVAGFEIAAVYDYDIEKSRKFADTFGGRIAVCEKLHDMLGKVDAVAVFDCDGSGYDHLKLATPFLKAGLPTFVDKPFALTVKDAKAIASLARKHKAPLFNASILSHVPAAAEFKNRFAEISKTYWPVPDGVSKAPVKLGVVKGVGGAFSQDLAGKAVTGGLEDRMAYIIHGVSLGLNLFGHRQAQAGGLGVEWVEAMGTLPLEYLHIHLKHDADVMVMNTAVDVFPEECGFFASAYSKFGAIHSPRIGDPEFLGGGQIVMQKFKAMCASGKPPADYNDFIEHIAVVEAGMLAQQKGRRVYLKEVFKR